MDSDYKKIDNYFYKPTDKPLGKGAFATVHRAYDSNQGDKQVAVKVIPALKMLENQETYDLFMREIEVLRQIKGDHIVQLLDVKRTTNNLYIFTEYCNGGDLDNYLKKNGALGEKKALEIMYQFSKGFNTINGLEIKNSSGRKVIIMHRDIKSANILFNDDVLKIADFGFAKMIDEASKNVKMDHTLLGTPLYMAPQILNDEAYTSKCDIWSTGLLFYECIYGKLPWTGNSISNLYKNIKTQPLKYPTPLASETKDLLEKMLQIDESKRISWKEIEEHPAMKAAEKDYKAKFAKPEPVITTVNTNTTNLTTQLQQTNLGGGMGYQQQTTNTTQTYQNTMGGGMGYQQQTTQQTTQQTQPKTTTTTTTNTTNVQNTSTQQVNYGQQVGYGQQVQYQYAPSGGFSQTTTQQQQVNYGQQVGYGQQVNYTGGQQIGYPQQTYQQQVYYPQQQQGGYIQQGYQQQGYQQQGYQQQGYYPQQQQGGFNTGYPTQGKGYK